MRIGYDAKRIFHNWRGLGNYSRDLVKGQKHYFPENEYLLFSPQFKSDRAIEFSRSFGEGNIFQPSGFFSRQFPSVWRRNLASELVQKKVELFHGLSHEIPYGLKKNGIKSIVTIHDLIFMRYPEYFPWIDRRVYLSKVKHAVNESDCIIAICEQTKEDLINFLNVQPEKIQVCYQSCHEQFQAGPSNDEAIQLVRNKYKLEQDYFLFVGALEERKNILNLIEGFSYFGPSRELIIIGRNCEYRNQIELKIKQTNMDNSVRILTDVPSEDLPALYTGADIFCFPSFFEGFGIPLIEAMFCGTPVITSEGSCFPEVAGKGALYVNPLSSFQIAKAMYEITTKPELREQLMMEGAKQVEKFSSENTNQRLNEVYQQVMNS